MERFKIQRRKRARLVRKHQVGALGQAVIAGGTDGAWQVMEVTMLRVCSGVLQGLTVPLLPHACLASKATPRTLLAEHGDAQPNGL